MKVLYIALILSKLEYASVAWNSLTLADSNKLENIQKKFANLCYTRFFRSNSPVITNQFCIIYISKYFIPGNNILTLYFLLTFSRTKLTVVLLRILLVSVYSLRKWGNFPPLTSVMSQDFALQQGVSQLQTASADLWTFSINILSSQEDTFSFA
jgi:hypothetical protein